MCVNIGNYKLYFSYDHLIAFETPTNKYITKKKFNYSGKHRNFIENSNWSFYYSKGIHIVEQNVLELMVSKEMLKDSRLNEISINPYYGYYSNNSKYKAMCVKLGKYKLYFSYRMPIAFETPTDQYVTTLKYSVTTSGHIWSAKNWEKNIHSTEQKVLKLIILTHLLKLPFEEAKNVTELYCERVHFT